MCIAVRLVSVQSVAADVRCLGRELAVNQLSGSLPAVWADPGAFPSLSSL